MAKSNEKRRRSLLKRKGFWFFCVFCLLVGGIAAWVGWQKLQPYRERATIYDLSRIDEVEVPSQILDRKGREIGRMFVENRSKLSLDKVPDKLIKALLAQEDQRFYEHDGVDWVGVGRAGYLTLRHMEVTQGASTITMQLARNAFDLKSEALKRDETGVERKLVEAFLAMRIEREMAADLLARIPDETERKMAVKRRILEFYLNRIPFGSGYYGVRSASLGYFGKEPADLDLQECASLVACVKNPSVFSPLNNPEMNRTARNHVLNRMAAEGMISEEERLRLQTLPVAVNPKPILRGKSHLYERIAREAREQVGEEAMSRGGYKIHTTIDLDLQREARESMRRRLAEVEKRPGYAHPRHENYERAPGKTPAYLQGAVFMMNHETGEVLAHVGGRDYADSQYDFVELGARPTGTAFFPFVYAAAFENGKTPASSLMDEAMDNRRLMVGGREGVVGEWGMEVPNPVREGKVTARRGLNSSKIAATVRLGMDVGLDKVRAQAERFGLQPEGGELLNRMLVGWDAVSLPQMVQAYSVFPRGGSRLTETYYIRSIEDHEGNERYRSPLLSRSAASEEVCSPATAYQVHSILNDTMQNGNLAGKVEGLGELVASGGAKSGTPYGFSDAWMMSYTSKVSCAIWMGFFQGGNEPIYEGAFASDLTLPVWRKLMARVAQNYASSEISPPDSVVAVPACRVSGLRSTRYCSEPIVDEQTGAVSFRSTAYLEYFRKDDQIGYCTLHGPGTGGEGLADGKPLREALPVIPVKPTGPLLIGADPYQSEVPTIVPSDKQRGFLLNHQSLMVDDQLQADEDAEIRLSAPKKAVLLDN
ncbi:MAG: transglycosylase domain-containing protein [Verrucomicrobiales bacterium]